MFKCGGGVMEWIQHMCIQYTDVIDIMNDYLFNKIFFVGK